MRALRAL